MYAHIYLCYTLHLLILYPFCGYIISLLLLDCLGHEFDSEQTDRVPNISKKNPSVSLEIGCGTGVATIFLATLLAKKSTERVIHHLTDINDNAIRIAMKTANINGLNVDCFDFHHCDLATPLLDSLHEKVDVLIFNPPYVPTSDDEVGSTGIEASWAGGKNGRTVLDRALPQISMLLSRPYGVAFIITIDENNPEEIATIMLQRYQIQVTPVLRRRARNEFLSVLKLSRLLES